jgi:hypothetical protein
LWYGADFVRADDVPIRGRGGAAELADLEVIRREVERRWEFYMRRLRSGVPARNRVDRVAFSQDAPLRLVRCRDCWLRGAVPSMSHVQ